MAERDCPGSFFIHQMFQPNYPKSALGLEREFITALAIQRERQGRIGIRQASTVDLPAGLLNPGFLTTNLPDPAGFSSYVSEACERAGLQGQKKWSVSLPGNSARSAILTLEAVPASGKELDEVLDWKAESSFGAPTAELRVSRQKISPDREGKTRYFATAVTLAVVDEFESLFESMGWQAGLVVPRALGEANWLMGAGVSGDSLLISSQFDGFTAFLIRNREPVVVRNVTCAADESDDEIFRLLMYYKDRFASETGASLSRALVVGKDFDRERIGEVAREALGRDLAVLDPADVGLEIPVSGISFDELAAPAGLAALGL